MPSPDQSGLNRVYTHTFFYLSPPGSCRLASQQEQLTPENYQPRVTACTAPGAKTSGKTTATLDRALRSAEDFWTKDSKRLGEEGLVLVALKISSTGCATAATIVGSSGFDALDQAVLQFYESLEFFPAEAEGTAVESTATLPVIFKLRQ